MRRQRAEVNGGDGLRRILRRVRSRWRMRRVFGGVAITVTAALAAIALTTWGLEAARFSETAVLAFRIGAWSIVAVLTALLVLRPLVKRVSDEQIALYLEEHEPSLEAAILGAVEAERAIGDDAAQARLLDQLVARAVQRARSIDDGRRIDQAGLQRASGALAVATLATLMLLLFGPTSLRRGATALLPTSNAAALNPYSIGIEPGDVTIARGSDQLVTARLVGFDAEDVTLFTRRGDTEMLQRLSMIPTDETGTFDLLLLGLDEGVEYFVESDGVRSNTFTIEVLDLPYVDVMNHVYRFPAYTGLDPREIEDAGDVAALAGTRVDLEILPTIPTAAGRLLLDGEPVADLEVAEDGSLRGTLNVQARGYYSIELALGDGRYISASPEYRIDLLSDQSPSITVTKPGRDQPVSPIEEVFFEVRADDDYGIDRVLLMYSVNGGPTDSVEVFTGTGRPLGDVTAAHTLYLEDFDVTPGDLVTYWASARDQRNGPGEEVVSDIYFLKVEPFGRDFREQEQQAGGEMQGGQPQSSTPELSELQKQVTAATFNLIRDRERYTEDEFSESATSVALAQGRVAEQVQTLVERMGNRGVTDDENFAEIAQLLPTAIQAMDSSRTMLEALQPQDALAPQQWALVVLQKAEETYERYVSMSNQQQQGGGGGGGDRPNAEDLADLFELELDRLQNQYETVQRGERQQQNEEVDELLERLEELARRQQQEAERQQARASQQGGSSSGGSSAQSQRELADQAEETARQLQRLSRETGDPELAETARDLQEAADAMRRSAANAGNTGVAEAERALDRLEEAQNRLQQDREERLESDTQGALERGRALQEQQESIRERLENLSGVPQERAEQIRQLQSEKTDMMTELQRLEQDLDRLAGDARQRDPETARALTEAAEAIRRPTLPTKVAWSRGVIQDREESYVRIFEEGIEADLENLEDRLEAAAAATSRLAEEEGLSDALEQAEDLVRGMESLDRRLEARGRGEGQRGLEPGAQDGPQGEEGQQGQQQGQGQQGEGQQGQQQGQGEQGQQGQGQQGEGQQGQGQQQGDGQGNRDGQNQGGMRGGGGPDRAAPGARNDGLAGGAPVQINPNARPFTEDEIRQFRREFQERLQEATDLREVLRAEGQETADIDEALAAMRQLVDADTYASMPNVLELQSRLRQSLGRLEFTLRRQVEGEGSDRAALTGSDAVPDGFRRLVDEYYRALARSGGGG